jgi:DEAD/DEAH box helicase domain-containing protein
VVIATGTASGKTLAYNLPVIDQLLRDERARGLYLFPTKALAQDQLSGLRRLLSSIHPEDLVEPFAGTSQHSPASIRPALELLNPAIYDGDTPSDLRPGLRKSSRLILSNPDMLHAGILPHHTLWSDFFQDLRFVILDEMHTYRGVFGSHVANLLRRLRRVSRFYGANPQFLLTSATIGNPVELAEKLIESPVTLVKEDGAGRPSKHFLIYNPPIINPDLGLRRSALLETARLVDDLLHEGVQTIIFGRSRRTVEILLTYLRERAWPAPTERLDARISPQDPNDQHQELGTIRGYRAGYLPRQRREIERGLRQGEVQAVVATNALELGIDIGKMGAAVLVGYPGTIASTWQQAGRAGRDENESLAVLVTTANPLDQFLAHHPDYFYQRSPENALINPDNLLILLAHLRCAAFELPFSHGEKFGKVEAGVIAEILEVLRQQGYLHQSGSNFYWMADKYPADQVSLRSAAAQEVVLQVEDSGSIKAIGTVDYGSAPWMVHPQAVYLHEAQTFLVHNLDLDQAIATLKPASLDFYTQPQSESTVDLVELHEQGEVPGAIKARGEILVTTRVTGFRKLKWFTHEQVGVEKLDLPPTTLQTTGYWIALSESTVDMLRQQGLWTNDPNQYGPAWPAIRQRVRERDGYCCQLCGSPEQGRAHDVHHKIPFRAFSTPDQANQLHNLITLCPACHNRVETSLRMRSGLAGLAYALGNLAPLFVMCDSRDLGVHSDPQASLSQGQPTAVLYDRIPAGIGLSERLYEIHDELMLKAYELVTQCECTDGCPSCVGPAGENGLGGRRETMGLLGALIHRS